MSGRLPGWSDYALLATLGTIWGGSFMLIKIAIGEVPPATMTLLRLAMAAVILFAVATVYREKIKFGPAVVANLVLVGLFGNALPFTLISWGEEAVDASVASILMGIMPISTLILAHLLTDEDGLTARKLVGVGIGFAGLVVLVGPAVLMRLGEDGIRQLAILGAAVSYALNAVLTKRLLGLPRRAAAAWLLLMGAFIMLPISILWEEPSAIEPGLAAIGAVVLLGIFPTAIAALVMFEVLQRQGAAFFGQVNFLVPVAGVAWAALILGERPDINAYLALAFILVGIWIARGGRTAGLSRAIVARPATQRDPVE